MQLAENPRAASDDDANARIDDMLENVSSPLLMLTVALFNHFGRYEYPSYTLPSSSRAVDSLFARIIIFFSRKNVASQSEKIQ